MVEETNDTYNIESSTNTSTSSIDMMLLVHMSFFYTILNVQFVAYNLIG